jgi:Lon protease-like protein
MTNFIPVFPLQAVVYPGEELQLHIFEPRYRQLIQECYTSGKPFGIPALLGNEIAEMGTLVQVTAIRKVYEDGKMDITTQGQKVFRILEFVNSIPGKLYSGAIVNYPPNEEGSEPGLAQKVITILQSIFAALHSKQKFSKPNGVPTSYHLAQYMGFSLQQKYELLGLLQERQRLEYQRRHLQRLVPPIADTDRLFEKTPIDGHFFSKN